MHYQRVTLTASTNNNDSLRHGDGCVWGVNEKMDKVYLREYRCGRKVWGSAALYERQRKTASNNLGSGRKLCLGTLEWRLALTRNAPVDGPNHVAAVCRPKQ